MATYKPPYPPKVKESINVDFKDRWTAQKVKFINRENEFYGTFYGVLNLSATNVSGFIIDDSEFKNGRINNSSLSNSFVLTENGEKISFDSLISSQNIIIDNIGELFKRTDSNSSKIDGLSSQVLSNSNSIEDLYKKISGGLIFKGVLSIDDDYDYFKWFLDGKTKEKSLSSGWYYLIETTPISAHYKVEGVDISYRDCLIIKNGKEIENITSSDVVVYDMMDKDVVHTKEFQEISSLLNNKIDFVDDKLSNFYNKNETSSSEQIDDEFDITNEKINQITSDYVKESELSNKIGNNINFWYDNKDLSIYLSAGNRLYGVDTTDFIQDNIRNIKFIGHINITKQYNEQSSLVEIFDDQNLLEYGKILNGSFYNIKYNQTFDISSKLSTTDGFVFGDGDYLLFHEHSPNKFIDISLSSSYILKCGASRYEIEKIINDINEKSGSILSTDNTFTGKNIFTNDLCIEFGKTYDTEAIYLSNIFDKLDDNPFVLEIANRTIDILNITGLNREISFNISTDNIEQMINSISVIAEHAEIEITKPITELTLDDACQLLNDSIDNLLINPEFNTLKERLGIIRSDIANIQNRIQYDEQRVIEISGNLDEKINDKYDELTTTISSVSSDVKDYITTKFNEAKDYSDTKICLLSSVSSDSYSSNLSVIKLTNEDYDNLVKDEKINESALYVITDDYLDARGQQIRNVSDPTKDTDVVNKKYVDNTMSEFCDKIIKTLSSIVEPIDSNTISNMIESLINIKNTLSV